LKRSNRLVLLVGVFLAVVAFVGIVLLIGQPKPTDTSTGGPNASPAQLPTVIAAKDIGLGVTITSDMLGSQVLDTGARRGDAFQDPSQAIGQVARTPIKQGAQIGAGDFSTATTGCTTVPVPTGQRAIALQVDQVSGVGTLINPGDYVDLLVGFTGDKFPVVTVNPTDQSISAVGGLNGTSVKLLLEGMQVLCRQLPPPAAPQNGQPAPSAAPGTPTTSLNGQQEIVILGVTPTQAEVIKFSQLDGSISLVLRSGQDFPIDPATGVVIPPPPSGSEGITLKKLTTDFAVPIPELVEAILPTQSGRP
jgi:pilus assembly protein CpaB